jgi:DNA replication protein DnaC
MDNFRQDVYLRHDSKKIIYAAGKAVSYYLEHAEEFLADGMGIYLYSMARGSGKTRLAASMANELLKKHQVKFSTSMNILDEIKRTWDKATELNESQLLDDLCMTEILIIDDFGTEDMRPWVNDKYYQIINQRYINRKPTFFTSNLKVEELRYDDRIKSRIKEKTFRIAFPEECVREYIANERNKAMIKDALR